MNNGQYNCTAIFNYFLTAKACSYKRGFFGSAGIQFGKNKANNDKPYNNSTGNKEYDGKLDG
jgi:hypothetical protein